MALRSYGRDDRLRGLSQNQNYRRLYCFAATCKEVVARVVAAQVVMAQVVMAQVVMAQVPERQTAS